MATIPLLLGFVPIVSAPSVASDEWDVQAEVDDPSERFSAFDVSVGNVVFLDLLSSTTAPNTAGRYVVQSILSRTASTVRVILRWGGDGAGIDPVEGAGHRGFLTVQSPRNSLAWMPSARSLMLPPELVDASRNAEQFVIVDKFAITINGSGTDQTARDRQVRTLPTDRTFTVGQLVTRRGGVTQLACPQDDLRMPAVGIALGMGSGSVLVQGAGIVSNPVFAFEAGLPVFVSDTGGMTQDPAAVTRPGWLQVIGTALDATVLSLSINGQATKR